LIDLNRINLKVRSLVSIIEMTIIEFLAQYNVVAEARSDAPGVYVDQKKIGSLGLRLKNQCCYHGLSLNVDMDLTPFEAIDPCGYANLSMTQTKDLGINLTSEQVGKVLVNLLKAKLEACPTN
jgi:lipoyl(octanoyl) transferase